MLRNIQTPVFVKVSASTGLISTVAGNGVFGYNGDGIAATSAELSSPTGVAVDGAGNIYIADFGNNRIRKVSASTGLISTVAGNGTQGYNGDGIAATSAELDLPVGVAVDGAGNIYIADFGNNRIRKVSASTGLISTVAGNGTQGYNGDGIAATSAELNYPVNVAVDDAENIYVGDTNNDRVRKVSASTGLISTVAGNGTQGYNGDGIAATSAGLYFPDGVAVDSAGNIYIADAGDNRIRKVSASTGLISTVAGNGTQGYNGDGIAATSAQLYNPNGVAVDSAGNLFIADYSNQRIRKVSAGASGLSFASTAVGSTSSDSPQTVALSNNGNAALTFPIPSSGNNPSISPSFTLNSSGGTACPLVGSTASSASTLAPGASCTLPISFVPTSAGSINGSLVLTDNSMNVSNAAQTISLSGTGTGVSTTTSLGSSLNPSSYGQSVTITATVAAASGTATPTGTVQFSVDGSPAGSAATLSSGTAAYTTSTLNAGAHSITAVYSPGTGSAFITSSSTPLSQTVNKATSSVTTWPTASSITYGQTLASSTLTGGQSTPAGSFSFTTPTTSPGAGTAFAGRDLHAHRYDRLQHGDRHGERDSQQSNITVTAWPTASVITYGQTLASSTLSGGASTPAGSFALTTPTTAPGAGTAFAERDLHAHRYDRLQHGDRYCHA